MAGTRFNSAVDTATDAMSAPGRFFWFAVITGTWTSNIQIQFRLPGGTWTPLKTIVAADDERLQLQDFAGIEFRVYMASGSFAPGDDFTVTTYTMPIV